jgi:endonuclease/exonuclease/phosphatase (EEP) superfamily protein YafD
MLVTAGQRGDSADSIVRGMRRGLVVVVAALGVATAVGFLDRVSWVFETATLFRLQYAVVLTGAALLALPLGRPGLAVSALALAGVNIAVTAPWQGAPRSGAAASRATLRIVSFNVESGNDQYGRLAPLVARLRPDVLGLIELTPQWARTAEDASAQLRPRLLVAQPGAYGMGILSTDRPATVRARRFPADGPTALVARFRLDRLPVTFVLVHVHTPFAGSVHERELSALAAARPRLGSRLIVCGDFNTVPWSAQFERFAHATGLTDVFRGAWSAHSWPSWSPLLGALIDHCLISDGLVVKSRRLGPSIGSDHRSLVLDVAIARTAA